MNETMRRFGWPDSLVADFEHWAVLLRPTQPTLGALILAAKSEATAFGDLPDGAHAELRDATRSIENALSGLVGYQRINYLMLMMVDPHVHFHVLPRYEGERGLDGFSVLDQGWPGPPDLKSAVEPDAASRASLRDRLRATFSPDGA